MKEKGEERRRGEEGEGRGEEEEEKKTFESTGI